MVQVEHLEVRVVVQRVAEPHLRRRWRSRLAHGSARAGGGCSGAHQGTVMQQAEVLKGGAALDAARLDLGLATLSC